MSSTYYCEGCTAEARDGNICKNGLPTGSDHVHKWILKPEGLQRLLSAYKTPSPLPKTFSRKTPHRDSTKQKNMRRHVLERNQRFWQATGDEYRCDICCRQVTNPSHLINSRIVAHANAKRLCDARLTNKYLISSPSYDCNGLFLCGDCDENFEDHNITIDGDGTIRLKPGVTIKPEDRYEALRNTKVKWADDIGVDQSWPSAALLEFRKTLPAVVSRHRSFKFSVLDDDHSTASSDKEEEEEEREGSGGVKLGKRSAKSRKGQREGSGGVKLGKRSAKSRKGPAKKRKEARGARGY